MKNAICYKTKEPTYYNKGTKWEIAFDTFLAYYCENADKEATRLNDERPEKDACGNLINWENILYFFAHEQEELY